MRIDQVPEYIGEGHDVEGAGYGQRCGRPSIHDLSPGEPSSRDLDVVGMQIDAGHHAAAQLLERFAEAARRTPRIELTRSDRNEGEGEGEGEEIRPAVVCAVIRELVTRMW